MVWTFGERPWCRRLCHATRAGEPPAPRTIPGYLRIDQPMASASSARRAEATIRTICQNGRCFGRVVWERFFFFRRGRMVSEAVAETASLLGAGSATGDGSARFGLAGRGTDGTAVGRTGGGGSAKDCAAAFKPGVAAAGWRAGGGAAGRGRRFSASRFGRAAAGAGSAALAGAGFGAGADSLGEGGARFSCGISCSGGGGIGVRVQGASASTTALGIG